MPPEFEPSTLEYDPPAPTDETKVAVPFMGLDDGEQLIRKRAYYSIPYEDEYGFFSPAGFESIVKNSVYAIGEIESTTSRKKYEPALDELSTVFGNAEYLTPWRYGEEPIRYKDATPVANKSTQDEDWSTFIDYVDNEYQNSYFSCYQETETYLNWYDYEPEDLSFGFEWKSDAAEWKQSNQLRALNRTNHPGSSPSTTYTMFEVATYGYWAEAPWLDVDSGGNKYGDIWVRPDPENPMVAEQQAGFQNSTAILLPDYWSSVMQQRFKSLPIVDNMTVGYLDALTSYVMNTGYTTVLKRAVVSRSQAVSRFTRREFTAMAAPTISVAPIISSDYPTGMPGATFEGLMPGISELTTEILDSPLEDY